MPSDFHDERTHYFYILKTFPFSLKGDAKIWFNSLDPVCVRMLPLEHLCWFSLEEERVIVGVKTGGSRVGGPELCV